ncbi:MAG TPA: beta-phosphoglucomutase, partial [Anaerolineales bacterium]
EPGNLHQRETVFTIGNGYLGTRGSFEEGFPAQQAVTLIHGVFDDIPISLTELTNTPNWPDLQIFAGGERFRMERSHHTAYQRDLDLRTGVLARKVIWQVPTGGSLELQFERFASLADEHVLALRCRVHSIDYSGPLNFQAALPAQVDNAGWLHWEWVEQGRIGPLAGFIQVQTRATKIDLCEAFCINMAEGEALSTEYWDSLWSPTLVLNSRIEPGQYATIEKLVTVFTSRDVGQPKVAAVGKLTQAANQGYAGLRLANDAAWASEWERCDITIEGDDESDRALRYNLFQLLIAAPRNDDRVSIGAKSLSGFGYRGHAFWDTEIFILPFFIYTSPKIARNLLMYRYHTLPGARRKAKAAGYEGAMFAWESAATGDEATPRWVSGPDSTELIRIWPGDIEHHITADIAYAVYRYWQVTGDDDFMRDYGAEIFLDAACFWGSRSEWNAQKGYYEICNVIGPDENHDHVDNNAYTNNLARWNLTTAFPLLGWLRRTFPEKAADLENRLDLAAERMQHWKDVIDRMYLGYNPATQLFEQFEGFYQRRNVDLQSLEPRSKSFQALMGVQKAQEYQIIKQPDVLMLLYLLHENYDVETLKANWDYYSPRTDLSYGSSLGPSIQSILATRIGETPVAYQQFLHAARTDLYDARGNTADGIHAATDGGLWQAAVFGFGGLEVGPDGPVVHGHLPESWKRLHFRIQYRGHSYDFDLRTGTSQLSSYQPEGDLYYKVRGAIFDLDGVLTDTSDLHYLGWKRLADEEGIPFTRQDNEALRGISRRESLLLLLKGRPVSEAQIQEMMDRKNRYYVESIQELSPDNLLPGARQLLEEMRSFGTKIAIGSASKNARTVIERLGIGSLVDAISDGFSVTQQKPAPDLFLHAAAQLGLPPEECVVFEDAEAGVAAALAGGMLAVGIGPQERVGAAQVVLPNLVGVAWTSLRYRLERAQARPQ